MRGSPRPTGRFRLRLRSAPALALALAAGLSLAAVSSSQPSARDPATTLLRYRAPSLLRGDDRTPRTGPDRLRPPARSGGETLEAFTERRRREAAVEVRSALRVGEGRLEAIRLRREGTPEEVERATRDRERAEERDALRTAVDLEALERRTGWPLGPVTRRILATRLRPARTLEEAERERETRELREAAEAREREGERGFLEIPGAAPDPLR